FEPPTSRVVVISAEANFEVKARPDPSFLIKDVMIPDKVLAKLEKLNSNKSAGATKEVMDEKLRENKLEDRKNSQDGICESIK
ncbi:hypothetical protein BpHYR1_052134, partial [Brachionus plicatilis]